MSGADIPSGTARTVGWYGELARQERRTFWACFFGWALDAMDVQMFSFAIPAIIAAFRLSNADAGFIGTATLLTSALGGWIGGALADRFGRVRILQITIVWFALFTLLCGLAQSGTQLLVMRALMGFGFGGEWAAGAVLIGEVVGARHRGKVVGTVQSGWAIGWAIAALAATALFSVLPDRLAWRALFCVGVLPAFLVFFLRRFVDEPPAFKALWERVGATGDRPNAFEVFSPAVLRTTVLTALLATGAQGGYYAITTWLPTFLKTERKLSVINSGGYIAVIILGSFVGYIVGAHLADRIGRRANFMLFAVGSLLVVLLYTQLAVSDALMLVLGFPLGFFASGIFSGMGAFLTENFPTRMRGSGQGFAYNFGRGIGALNPFFVGMLSATLPLGQSIGVLAAIAYALVGIAILLLPETRGRELAE